MKFDLQEEHEDFWLTLTPETLEEVSLVSRMALQSKFVEAHCWEKGIEGYIIIPRYKPAVRTSRIKSRRTNQ